jgi:SHS2 domain-containing protein
MSYEFTDHTADVAVELRAESRAGLFRDALRAFTDTVTDLRRVDGDEGHDLEASGETLEELMVEWLGELVYRFDVDGLLFRDVTGPEIEETGTGFRLTGRALGEPYDEERHPLKVEIKGVTYHELAVEQTDGSWRGRVIFDI